MNLVDELVRGHWGEKTAKSLNLDSSFSNLATFHHFHCEFLFLMDYLTPLCQWGGDGVVEWERDLAREPKNTIDILRALKGSWQAGNYGVLSHE